MPVRFKSPSIADAVSALAFACVSLGSFGSHAIDGPGREHKVVFFHSPISISGDDEWSMTIQGRIYEPPETSLHTQLLVKTFAVAVPAWPRDQIYKERAGYFLSDSARDMSIGLRIGEQTHRLPPSDAAGFFSTKIPLSGSDLRRLAKDGVVAFESVPTPANREIFRGTAIVVPETGVTVVTDIDDTIKITHVLNSKEMRKNTFLKAFEPVDGMPETYASWKGSLGLDTRFHAVSAGPWQFNEPLRAFVKASGFPEMTWDMRSIDIPNVDALKLELSHKLDKIFDFKLQTIRALMDRFKQRHFVLVGDSGERDPEVYAQVLSEYEGQVDAVFIRDVHGKAECARQAKRFKDLFPKKEARAKLYVFSDPRNLPPLPIPPGDAIARTSPECPYK